MVLHFNNNLLKRKHRKQCICVPRSSTSRQIFHKITGKESLFFFPLVFLRLHPWHMEFRRLGVEWELQLPAYATVTAMPDLSHICDIHHSSQQCRILNPLSKARDRTSNRMVPSRITFHCAMMGTPHCVMKGTPHFSFFFLFTTAPVAYGCFQARG